MKILITGAAGFIGSHTTIKLIKRSDQVIGIDNINDYYDTNLKETRLEWIQENDANNNFKFIKLDICNKESLENLFAKEKFDKVIHLAAQAGVRFSITNPDAYINSNIVGFLNILENCRHHHVQHLVYASSSSVYGANEAMPFSIHHNVDHPLSLYAATKKSNELMAHTYSSLYQLSTTGLRFFTVYGPWGRPDMALFLFTKAILEDKPIDVFNHGNHKRDFTYIDDIVTGIISVLDHNAKANNNWDGNKPDPGTSKAPWRVYNIGSNNPIELNQYIQLIERYLEKKATKNLLPMQPGDVPATYADVQDLADQFDYQPSTSIEKGIKKFIDWYLEYYK